MRAGARVADRVSNSVRRETQSDTALRRLERGAEELRGLLDSLGGRLQAQHAFELGIAARCMEHVAKEWRNEPC
jgi:hypothetical protein